MPTITLQWVPLDSGETVRHVLRDGATVRLGRAPASGWQVSGDQSISREHADLWLEEGRIAVRCLDTARVPLVVDNKRRRQALIPCGGSFQIGSTLFQVIPGPFDARAPERADKVANVVLEHQFAAGELSKVAFHAVQQRIEILADLPTLISTTQTDEELAVTVARLLLEGIAHAEAVAVVQYEERHLNWDPASGNEFPSQILTKVETRKNFNKRFVPSRRLILQALQSQKSVLQIWEVPSSQEFTMTEDLGWAFVCPLQGEGCAGWCVYVSGKGARNGTTFFTKDDLAGDLRFVELLASFIASIRQVRLLQDQRTQLSAFFSPNVIKNLTNGTNRAVLEPSERDVTVLFCDLRGFSKRSEMLQHDLLHLLRMVSEALGVMAEGVLSRNGAIADFQGDAILGFWGWPLPQPEGPLPACRCALAIDAAFRSTDHRNDELLAGISCGIGIAHGRALAGKIGTAKQSKIGVFGPVVNQGSRLEGMTKQFGVGICIDHATADFVRRHLPASEARVRHLAYVRPKGMTRSLDVYALYPSEEKLPAVSTELIVHHETAVRYLIGGQWYDARRTLEKMPALDGAATFIHTFLSKAGDMPPAGWDGAIQLENK